MPSELMLLEEDWAGIVKAAPMSGMRLMGRSTPIERPDNQIPAVPLAHNRLSPSVIAVPAGKICYLGGLAINNETGAANLRVQVISCTDIDPNVGVITPIRSFDLQTGLNNNLISSGFQQPIVITNYFGTATIYVMLDCPAARLSGPNAVGSEILDIHMDYILE